MADRLTASLPPSHFGIRLLRLPTRASLATAHDAAPDTSRELVIIEVLPDGERDQVAGWGEISALNTAGYTSEWAAGSFELLRAGHPIDAQTHPMTAAGIEMALLDAELRHAGESLAQRLGTAGGRARAGAVVGLDTIPAMLDEAEALATAGYRRIKAKVVPGRLIEPIRAIVERLPGLEVHIDANGSLGAADLPILAALRDLGVLVVEQPFAVGDHGLAARLVAETDLQVVADEAITTIADVWNVANDQAATAVSLKPPRVGGLRTTLEMLDVCATAGLGASIGGMLESGLGRHQLAALAPLAGFTIAGDLSPAGRWLAHDPFPDLRFHDGQVLAGDGLGIAGDPDLDVMDRYTVASAVIEATALR